jgi:hypothetical protein
MAAGFNLANKPDSAKLGEAELTIDYTIPELIHSIELVQRQMRIQESHYSQRGAFRSQRGTERNLRLAPTDVLCVSTNRPASATDGN